MKVIEVKINIEDFNYVEGELEIQLDGQSLSESKHQELYSIDTILAAKFIVSEKYIAPNVPKGISKRRLFKLKLPFSLNTIVDTSNDTRGFKVNFDEVIVDDRYVDEESNLKVNRYNTVKDGNRIFSTIRVNAYGLKKNQRQEIERITKYELFPEVSGPGQIKIEPNKDYYDIGEKVKITAIPDSNAKFLGWDKDFKLNANNKVEIEVTKDYEFVANFYAPEHFVSNTTAIGNFINDISSKKTWGNILSPEKKIPSYKSSYSDEIKEDKDYGYGCFSAIGETIATFFMVIGYLIYGLLIVFLIAGLFKVFGVGLLYFVLLFAVLWGLNFLIKQFQLLRVLRSIFNLVILFILAFGLFNLITNLDFSVNESSITETKPKTVELDKENYSKDYVHNINWEDLKGHRYKAQLRVNSDFVNSATKLKKTLPNITSEEGYNSTLTKLYNESKEGLYHVVKVLDSIKINNNISTNDFPQTVVSMVQSIPYYAILDSSCSPYDYRDESIRDLLMNNPCQGYVRFGIKSPSEFLKDLKGDCDSRTLFIYAVLKYFNYDVAIFGSNVYKHSVLGITSKSSSNDWVYKEYNGKKYYLWETTSKRFKMGELPQDISDSRFWDLNIN
ncbi:hypothetical protein [Winogradskyella sp. MH6]|uniref:hypothetical protein n=1 Tax=Winogradskyella sp. MH6 TaxID=2929510 RepID=UPI001FB5267A|nr:hypothetical protein [Winogradskyella sp. MH6]